MGDPYHTNDDTIKVMSSTDARLLAKTDSIFDMDDNLNTEGEGLLDICHNPADRPKRPEDIW